MFSVTPLTSTLATYLKLSTYLPKLNFSLCVKFRKNISKVFYLAGSFVPEVTSFLVILVCFSIINSKLIKL